jgi:hypothetical protein
MAKWSRRLKSPVAQKRVYLRVLTEYASETAYMCRGLPAGLTVLLANRHQQESQNRPLLATLLQG